MISPSRASTSAHRTLPAWWANTTKHLAQLNIPFGMVLDKPARADSELCGVVHDRLIDSKLKGNAQSAHALASYGEEPMASNFETEQAHAVTYSLMVIQAAAQQLALLDVKFPVVLDALVEAYACTMAFDRLETRHALYQSNLNFALAHQINAAVRLQDLNIPEPEIRLLQEYLIKNPGALAGRTSNFVAKERGN
jgi:uncharacterized protein YceK